MAKKFKIKGKHVVLSNFAEEDITDSYINWLNDSDVIKFSNQRFIKHDYLSCKKYFDSFNNSENLFISIKLTGSNKMIGTMTAYFSHHQTVDVGIMIGEKSKWGKGYGSDAWKTLLQWLKENNNIRKITAGTLAINFEMLKLLEDSGMHLEAVRKSQEVVNGKAEDILLYAIFSEN